jgi:hypothetical protein
MSSLPRLSQAKRLSIWLLFAYIHRVCTLLILGNSEEMATATDMGEERSAVAGRGAAATGREAGREDVSRGELDASLLCSSVPSLPKPKTWQLWDGAEKTCSFCFVHRMKMDL